MHQLDGMRVIGMDVQATVMLEHQTWKRRVEAEKNLALCSEDFQSYLGKLRLFFTDPDPEKFVFKN